MTTDPDDMLLAELAAALEPDLVPPAVVLQAARETFTWRTVDAELAALVYDSHLEDVTAGTRSAAVPRVLTFEVPSVTIELEIEFSGGVRRVVGQLVPPREARVEMLCDGAATGFDDVDAMGRFATEISATCRLLAVRCHLADGAVVVTAHASLWTNPVSRPPG